jgi:hypothetical protein
MICCVCGKEIPGLPYIKNGYDDYCSWKCWILKNTKEKTNLRGEVKN